MSLPWPRALRGVVADADAACEPREQQVFPLSFSLEEDAMATLATPQIPRHWRSMLERKRPFLGKSFASGVESFQIAKLRRTPAAFQNTRNAAGLQRGRRRCLAANFH